MYADRLQELVRNEVQPLLVGMGYALVELSLLRRKGGTRVLVVIHRAEGVGVEQCAEVSRALLPRLELATELGEVGLEVSSPGIERAIKRPEEYAIFRGRGVRVLPAEGGEWIGGIIEGIEAGVVTLRTADGRREFPAGSLRRARLDYRYDSA